MCRFAAPDKRRPVLVLSRPALLEVLHTALVTAVTTTVRGALTEVRLGVDEGLKQPSCVNLTNVFTVRQSDLHQFVGTVGVTMMSDVCRALAIATDCGA
jgi:mRNA interferase MazF